MTDAVIDDKYLIWLEAERSFCGQCGKMCLLRPLRATSTPPTKFDRRTGKLAATVVIGFVWECPDFDPLGLEEGFLEDRHDSEVVMLEREHEP